MKKKTETEKKIPEEFAKRMEAQLGQEAEEFFEALTRAPATSIRLHHRKGKTAFLDLEAVPWCSNGYYLDERPMFHLDPHWHGGAYYVQDASSMILDDVLEKLHLEDRPKIFLDVCAAPGGKSAILASHLGPEDVLIANEISPSRHKILYENLYKGGYLNTFITREKSSSFTEPFADLILIDAPCAGEGMMRKEPEALRQWTPELVEECSVLQQQIVSDAVNALLPGGYLVYSTCSYSQAENMDNVNRYISSHQLEPVELSFPPEWNISLLRSGVATGYQLYPHKVKGEGLFIAVLQKDSTGKEQDRKKRTGNYFRQVPGWLGQHLDLPDMLKVHDHQRKNAFITAGAVGKANEVLSLFTGAQLIAEAGERKGEDFIPSHFLAMSGKYASHVERIELSLDHSLDYLERKSGSLPDKANGWFLLQFDGTVLGWAKKTLSGWKNYYPLNWRLRNRKMQ